VRVLNPITRTSISRGIVKNIFNIEIIPIIEVISAAKRLGEAQKLTI
jgi:hypothetical protein